jgi:hypothetical protein
MLKRSFLLSLLVLSFLFSQKVRAQDDWKEGDILVQDLDCGPLCDAIERVTTGYNKMSFSHVGLLVKDNGEWMVLEAIGENVHLTPLDKFLKRNVDDSDRPKVVAGRLKSPYDSSIRDAIRKAKSLVGLPYDPLFLPKNDSIYCAEVITQSFFYHKKPLFPLQSMTFKDPKTKKTMSVWIDYYSNYGKAVPEGYPGLNPGAISRSDKLEIVYIMGKWLKKIGQ